MQFTKCNMYITLTLHWPPYGPHRQIHISTIIHTHANHPSTQPRTNHTPAHSPTKSPFHASHPLTVPPSHTQQPMHPHPPTHQPSHTQPPMHLHPPTYPSQTPHRLLTPLGPTHPPKGRNAMKVWVVPGQLKSVAPQCSDRVHTESQSWDIDLNQVTTMEYALTRGQQPAAKLSRHTISPRLRARRSW